MLRATRSNGVKHISKIGGGAPVNYVKQPYYLKNSYANPYLGTQHDGVSTGAREGFTVKPIHWLYRFRWNTAPVGSTPLYLRNPGGKMKHWLEISNLKKITASLTCDDAKPHAYAFIFWILPLTWWHLNRYFFYHPELTLYNFVMYPTKDWVQMHRYNDYHPMDKPVFRWFQRAPEFYAYDSYRELIDMGVIANDPYIEYMKSIGREKELTLYCHEIEPSGSGKGNLVKLLPTQWRHPDPSAKQLPH